MPGQQLIELTYSSDRLVQSNKIRELFRKEPPLHDTFPWQQECFKMSIPRTQKKVLLSAHGQRISCRHPARVPGSCSDVTPLVTHICLVS